MDNIFGDSVFDFFKNHLFLCLSFFGVLIFIIVTEFYEKFFQKNNISPQTAVNIINNKQTTIIDVREKYDYDREHIPNSVNIPMNVLEKNLENMMSKYKNSNILFVNNINQNISKIIKCIKNQDFIGIYVLDGGTKSWNESGFYLIKNKKKDENKN